MKKNYDRKNVAREINEAAKLYKKHLVGKRFMYVFDNRYIEVLFKAESFRHLTGVDTHLSAKSFYSYATRGILEASQIRFTATHPYDLCVRKIKHIGSIATMAVSECFMLEEVKTDTMSYKFGTTDLNFTLCLNKETDGEGDSYVVQSLRDEDCFSKSKTAYAVTHIFSCRTDEKIYKDLLYIDKSASMSDLPDCIKQKLTSTLLPND
ncbi:MAG: PBECR4 domain-containing protein [Oscillospiraceae bacterium]|nr:PBECR4 domain-containing protein [Oscillospiraceae bacterium]